MAFLNKLFGINKENRDTDNEEKDVIREEEISDESFDGESEAVDDIYEETAEELIEDVAQDVAQDVAEPEEEQKISFWKKLKNGLSKTKNALFGQIDDLLKNFVKVDEDLLEELEELLIMADVGVTATEYIIDELRERIKDGRLKEKE